jgi:hypothetical protein
MRNVSYIYHLFYDALYGECFFLLFLCLIFKWKKIKKYLRIVSQRGTFLVFTFFSYNMLFVRHKVGRCLAVIQSIQLKRKHAGSSLCDYKTAHRDLHCIQCWLSLLKQNFITGYCKKVT